MTSVSGPGPHPYLDHPSVLPFAHRGGAADGLENTAAAFRRAAALGYRWFETDVHTTADGRLVAFHDASLDRVTDARGRIAERPWSEVRRARVGGTEPLPLFEELVEEFPGARWNVDVKAESALEPLLGLIRRADLWDRVCVGSFSEARVARAARIAGPRLATSYGTGGVVALRMRSLGIPAPLRTGAVCAQVPEFHGGVRVVDRRFVRAAHRRGLQVHVWTVNEADRMRALLDLGVDGIMTDHPETLRTVLTERGAWV
ncbi:MULTISPECIES: glycerophosphodiester phosphodiesterase family protein [Streptomyces]|uniref:Glycerophosphodiester phosphodiesterase n=1 Tax=Streptomyces tsukubensis (strain DSM 42081 / NBRC 108919 / NRRL 18488 / 9993) TaxID=1114943 RepID=I2MV42_STRT9|nr:glycerophosphodiester phosphodiesterase family protein [Streptomyces tsukubensis]MYS63939.1 glycerophosphodiester phosphodiesterase [Streptomyces sp. SID5473]AZK93104.1 glycerophosphodiester phosphodiesterase [Streptomyces tsukubensis]EIF88639.1 glycerophosphoryl diester phosphodiesterase [Streptomyces tsukubensis NRRL18488]QKM70732.1 glycerophosphodiester phosphodiesterase [Streptomyces tsukubensis NRRL18488]TAI41170.1 glycerophosphodiester phosphodiesterase [Streptomyces tsukubensis]